MKRPLRLAYLLVPLAVGWLAHAQDGTAQTSEGSRFAFADTTLLRDTLGLSFARLFPLADSLHVTPDTLRALSIRYEMNPERLVFLADSMRVPVDSVGAWLYREQFNPLAATTSVSVNKFRYTTGYNIGRNTGTWTNNSDYSFARAGVTVRNVINISMRRDITAGVAGRPDLTSLTQTRAMSLEAGWRKSELFWLGGRANLQGTLTKGLTENNFSKGDYQVSMRSRQAPARNLTSEVNGFAGPFDAPESGGRKRGLSGELNGRVLYTPRAWVSQSADWQMTGNMAQTQPNGVAEGTSTNDYSTNVRGSLALFESAPAGLNVSAGLRTSSVAKPIAGTNPGIVTLPTHSGNFDVTLRLQRDANRFLNISPHWAGSQNATNSSTSSTAGGTSFVNDDDRTISLDGRYLLLGFTIDGRFKNDHSNTRSPSPRQSTAEERLLQHSRAIGATISRNLGTELTARAAGDVTLDSYDYQVNDPAVPTSAPPRDQYSQSYRVEGIYTPSANFNTAASLDVSRIVTSNLTSSSSSDNTEGNFYRLEWRWNARLLQSLTVTQRNSLLANYQFYTFKTGQDRLSMDYSTVTTLNAVLSPRLTLNLNHTAGYRPSGNYVLFPDGQQYFSPGSENRTSLLSATIAYTPFQALSLTVVPDYQQFNWNTRTAEGTVPQTQQRRLNFTAGANLNIPVGRVGRLSGNIQRTYSASRDATYSSGARISPVSEIENWFGSLLFSWTP